MAVPALAAAWTALGRAQVPPEDAGALARDEQILAWTFATQGGRSHASGDRPELGPMHVRDVATDPVTALRVGLSPSAFDARGALTAEYDTTAAHNHARVEVTATGPFEVVDGTGEVLESAGAGHVVGFLRSSGSAIAISAARASVAHSPVRVRPVGDSLLVVTSIRRVNRLAPLVAGASPLTPAPYRGELEVRASEADPARLRLVNVVPVEHYIAGVVANESLSSFHVEALRAQAIAARGYGIANVGRFASRGFDVDDSTATQVYRGQSSETPGALQAVATTEGLVLSQQGRIISALYSSSMGGHTEDNELVFPGGIPSEARPNPALRGVWDGEGRLPVPLLLPSAIRTFYTSVYRSAYEVDPATGQPLTALHRWTRTRTVEELLARMKESFGVPASATRVERLAVTVRGVSGRMMQLAVSGNWGTTLVTGWSDIRRLATVPGIAPGGTGPASAPNSPSGFDLTRAANGRLASVTFYGGGFGHNVGMSQYGSHGRALRGQTAEQIVRAYYTRVEVGSAPTALLGGGPPVPVRIRGRGRPVLVVVGHALGGLRVRHPRRGPATLRLRADEPAEIDLAVFQEGDGLELELQGLGPGQAIALVRLED